MPRFAVSTEVPVEKSRAEIERLLVRYKADGFSTGWRADAAMVEFWLNGLHIRFVLPIPSRTEKRFTHRTVRGYPVKATEIQAEKAWEQEVRSRWRALCLVVKAKLEAVECGISSIEREFLSFIVLANDVTLGDWIIANALPAVRRGEMPLALTAHREEPSGPVVEGELVP